MGISSARGRCDRPGGVPQAPGAGGGARVFRGAAPLSCSAGGLWRGALLGAGAWQAGPHGAADPTRLREAPGGTHENHRGYAGDCKLPARSWNMYLSFQAALLRLARTLAALDRSRPIRLSAILRTRARLRAAARSRTRLSSSRKVTSSTQCTAFSIDQ